MICAAPWATPSPREPDSGVRSNAPRPLRELVVDVPRRPLPVP
jgi:hypothetical protein